MKIPINLRDKLHRIWLSYPHLLEFLKINAFQPPYFSIIRGEWSECNLSRFDKATCENEATNIG